MPLPVQAADGGQHPGLVPVGAPADANVRRLPVGAGAVGSVRFGDAVLQKKLDDFLVKNLGIFWYFAYHNQLHVVLRLAVQAAGDKVGGAGLQAFGVSKKINFCFILAKYKSKKNLQILLAPSIHLLHIGRPDELLVADHQLPVDALLKGGRVAGWRFFICRRFSPSC